MKDTIHKVIRPHESENMSSRNANQKERKKFPSKSLKDSEHHKRKKAKINIFLHSDRDAY